MKCDPIITVLLPAYNAAEYLDRAIQSVLGQTFGDFELLIIDDGSTDATREVAASFRDPRIRYIGRDHRGLGATLNEGITLSRGRYVARMDADDECYSERLALQKQFLDTRTECGLVHGCVDVVDDNDRMLSRCQGFRGDAMSTRWQLIWKNVIIHSTVMMRTATLRGHQINYRSDLESSEDFDLWNRLSVVADIEGMNISLLRYRTHDKSFTATNDSDFHFDCFVEVLRSNFNRYGLALDERAAEELAIISEQTKRDPRKQRYDELKSALPELFEQVNLAFEKRYPVDGTTYHQTQSVQLLTWARYMAKTSLRLSSQLLWMGRRRDYKVLRRRYFWMVLAYALACAVFGQGASGQVEEHA